VVHVFKIQKVKKINIIRLLLFKNSVSVNMLVLVCLQRVAESTPKE